MQGKSEQREIKILCVGPWWACLCHSYSKSYMGQPVAVGSQQQVVEKDKDRD